MDRLPKGPNVGGMVGHCAVRQHAMGERSMDGAPATDEDIAAMVELVDEAMEAGALGFRPPHPAHGARRPAGSGTWATPDELYLRRCVGPAPAACSRRVRASASATART